MFHSHAFSAMRNFFCLAVVLTLLAVLMSPAAAPVNAADGINRYVSPGGSNTTDCSSAAAPCLTITYALNQSDPGDTLLLDVGVYQENLVINKNIRIVQDPAKTCTQSGALNYVPCAIIDGGGSERVIDINNYSAVVSLEKIAIRNGYITDDSGAGIRNSGTLTIDDASLYNNIIHLTDPTNNGYSYLFRGGAIDNQHELLLRSSSLHDNTAYNGGAISSIVGLLTVQNTEIYSNSAVHFGGGIWIPYGAPSTVENCTLWGNSAGYVGGGMAVSDDGVAENRGEAHVFNNVTISGNSAVTYGGGLVSTIQVTMDHSTLAENSAPGSGADLYLSERQTISVPLFDHSLINNTIVSNPFATEPICWVQFADTFDLSGGGNLSSDHSCDFTMPSDLVDSDPDLIALSDNGGHVRTRALPSGSPAIDHAGPYVLGADARGVTPKPGVLNGSVVPDVGAYEFVPLGYVEFLICLPIIMR